MRLSASFIALTLAGASLLAQCPYYSNGTVSAGLSRAGGGEDARLVYVDCLATIGLVRAKFGSATAGSALNGMPLTIAVYDDPNDDHNPVDAVLVQMATVPGGVTGGGTNQWQTYDLASLFQGAVPTTGGMWVAVGVAYPSGTSPGPGSIEFFNNVAPGTQWMATSATAGTINYGQLSGHQLVDIQTGPGFPPGSWVIAVESGAECRPYGNGCNGSNGVLSLAGDPQFPPRLGLPAILSAQHLPLGPALAGALLGLLPQAPALDLGTLFGPGPVGCLLHVQVLDFGILTASGGAASYPLLVPNNPALVGLSVLAQALAVDSGANAAGLTSSNGLRVVLGH